MSLSIFSRRLSLLSLLVLVEALSNSLNRIFICLDSGQDMVLGCLSSPIALSFFNSTYFTML